MSEWKIVNNDGKEDKDGIISFKTEKVIDKNPNIYLRRAEERLKEGEFDEALEETRKAREYGKRSSAVCNECSRIENTIYDYRNGKEYIRIANNYIRNGQYNEVLKMSLRRKRHFNNKQINDEISEIEKIAKKSLLLKLVSPIVKKLPIIIGSIIILIIVSSILVYNGVINPFIYSSKMYVDKSKIGINMSTKYNVETKVFPDFAKNKESRVEIEDSFICDIDGDKIVGKNIGRTCVNLYLNDKKIKSEEINVVETGIKDFTLENISDLKLVGDSITPELKMKYSNNIKPESFKMNITSSNSNIVKVIDNKKLEAVAKGTCTIKITVNGCLKEYDIIIYNKSNKNNSSYYDNNKYNNSSNSNYYDSYNYGSGYNSNNSDNQKNKNTGSNSKVISTSRVKDMSYNDDSYMFKNADSEYLTNVDLESLSKNKLAFLRNEICARHGYIFKEEPYRTYFNSKGWYYGTKDDLVEGTFNKYEEANLKLIAKYEN